MSARKKLNLASVYGALVLAAMAGVLSQSGLVFLLVAVTLLLGACYAGDIRTASRRR